MFRAFSFAFLLLALAGCEPAAPPAASTPGRVFILGFDGLTPDLVERLEAEGVLPNFARLREEGAVGTVRSTIPMISPPAWTTVATGVPPEAHGVWSFWIPEDGDPRGRFVDATSRLAPPIWEELSARERSVAVVNVPITSPPDPVNGVMVAGFPYPEGDPLTYPPELEAELTEAGYRRDEWPGPPAAGEELDWLREAQAIGNSRREVMLPRLLEGDYDFTMIVFTLPDRISHHLWKFHEEANPRYRADAPDEVKSAVRDVYVWCDEILGEVRAKLKSDTNLFVVSDHGFNSANFGLSKAHVFEGFANTVSSAAADAPAESRNLFGGDFWLGTEDEATRAAFVAHLQGLRDRQGRSVVHRVHDLRKGPEIGHGRELGPHVVAEEADGYLFVPGRPGDPLVVPLGEQVFSGWHRRGGYFGAAGYSVQAGPVRDFDLRDIAAMSLHLLGEKIPRHYVHNMPKRLFPNLFFVERPMIFDGAPDAGYYRPGERETRELDPSVVEQLESVGYTGGGS